MNNEHKKCCTVEHCCLTSALLVGGILFGVAAVIHLYRYFYPFPIIIGTTTVSDSASLVGGIILGIMSIWQLGTACRCSHKHKKDMCMQDNCYDKDKCCDKDTHCNTK